MATILPKFFEIENFTGWIIATKIFSHETSKSITDAMCAWNLDYENFVHNNLFFEQNLAGP